MKEKMKKYAVTVRTVLNKTYEVEAKSKVIAGRAEVKGKLLDEVVGVPQVIEVKEIYNFRV